MKYCSDIAKIQIYGVCVSSFIEIQSSEEITSVNMEEYRAFIIGKTGNGKSSLGNVILGRPEFPVASSMASTTTRVHQAVGSCDGERLRVIDTPDPVNLNLSDTAIKDEVARWKSLATGRFAILLAVRCDVRYTAEEYDIYKKIKSAWGDNSFRDHLVVAFTFGDRQDTDIHQELKTVCWELRSVLADAGDRYVVFSNRTYENEQQVRRLLSVLHDLEGQPPPLPLKQLVLVLAVVVVGPVCLIVFWDFPILKTFLFSTPVIFVGFACYVYRRGQGNILNFGMFMGFILRNILNLGVAIIGLMFNSCVIIFGLMFNSCVIIFGLMFNSCVIIFGLMFNSCVIIFGLMFNSCVIIFGLMFNSCVII